ncbi:MAG: NTP transferase domain-containing protein [Clostridia bacterium]|nr:NTP transferase domain-containing protein [Clostridia bacterium]
MKAIIMAGGEGRRLRPLTCTMPKPMAPLLNRPIIDQAMDLLKKHGFNEVCFTLRYMGEAIKTHIGGGEEWGISCSFSDPGRDIGTAGSVRFALDAGGRGEDEAVLILSGDGLTDIDLTALVSAHEKSGAAASIVLTRVAEPSEYGVAVTDENGFIERFIEKPEPSCVFSDYANTGVYVLSKEALELIPRDTPFDFSKDLFPLMMEHGLKLFGYKSEAYWCDIGDIDQYRRAQRDMLDGRIAFKTLAQCENGVYIEPNARLSPSVKLIPPCYIGSGALIAEGAVIGSHSVIGSGAVVEQGASIKRSIVLERAYIGANSELREAVVCENAWIEHSAMLFSGSIVGAGTHIGAGATLLPNAAVWPQKQVETGGSIEHSLIWGETARRAEFIGGRVRGNAARLLTPETALRLGASYASLLLDKLPAKLAVCTDGESVSVMLKQAVLSGVVSQGVDAASVAPCSSSCFAFTVSRAIFTGGIYIVADGERGAELVFLDENGCEADGETVRSLKAAFMLGEKKPRLGAELGLITGMNGMEEAFEHWLMEGVERKLLMEHVKTLRISADKQRASTLARLLLRLGWCVEESRERDKLSLSSDENTLCVLIDERDMLSLAVGETTADAQLILAVLAEYALEKGETSLVLPASLHEAYKEHLEKKGVRAVYAREEAPELMRETVKRGFKKSLHLPEAAVLTLCELFADGSLVRRLEALPKVFSKTAEVETSRRETGRMLREIFDAARGELQTSVDGLRLRRDTGWVIVKPLRSERAVFRIVAGSLNSEYAEELCDIYEKKLRRLREGANENGDPNEGSAAAKDKDMD